MCHQILVVQVVLIRNLNPPIHISYIKNTREVLVLYDLSRRTQNTRVLCNDIFIYSCMVCFVTVGDGYQVLPWKATLAEMKKWLIAQGYGRSVYKLLLIYFCPFTSDACAYLFVLQRRGKPNM